MKEKNDYHLESMLVDNPHDGETLYKLSLEYKNKAMLMKNELDKNPTDVSLQKRMEKTIRNSKVFYKRALENGYVPDKNSNELLIINRLIFLLFTLSTLMFWGLLNRDTVLFNDERGNQWLYDYNFPLNHNSVALANTTNYEPLTFLRTAVLNYVNDNNEFPENLNQLKNSFPQNYISEIPNEEISGINNTVDIKDNSGGWVYTKPEKVNRDNLYEQIEKAITPNNSSCIDCPFIPLEITISKEKHTLILHAGNTIFETFPVGLGKQNSTPNGEFTIIKKVINPNFHLENTTKPFGTRGMELSDPTYAIHGTFEEESISNNLSKGCIRLTISAAEALYALTPLGTNVTISDSLPDELEDSLEVTQNTNKPSPDTQEPSEVVNPQSDSVSPRDSGKGKPSPPPPACPGCEMDGDTVYHWSN